MGGRSRGLDSSGADAAAFRQARVGGRQRGERAGVAVLPWVGRRRERAARGRGWAFSAVAELLLRRPLVGLYGGGNPGCAVGGSRAAAALPPVTRPPTEEERADAERQRRARVAIHEAISTLEYQVREVGGRRFSPNYQGNWGENRWTLAEDPRYDEALRATERAFQALQECGDYDDPAFHVREPVTEALAELNRALSY
jgi:hypothetical protein